jgi:hypothetical protein
VFRAILPALALAERAALLAGARGAVPLDAFNGFLAFTVSLLDDASAGKLRASVETRDAE